MKNKILNHLQLISQEINQLTQQLKSLTKNFSQFKINFIKENQTSNKLTSKLFDLANLALAGTVFVQLVPEKTIKFSKILPGLVISAILYLIAYIMEKRK